MYRILVCEDEDSIRDFVIINLQRAGYMAVGVGSGEKALDTYNEQNGRFDIALLDVMLPGIDGFEVCRRLRAQSNRLGIIMLTAKTQELDKVNGLMLGADDYVSKPFSPSELMARVDALCRRINTLDTGILKKKETTKFSSGAFTLDTASRTLYKNGEAVELTQVEYQIIELFFKRHGQALKRNAILKAVWGENYVGDEKIVDVNIRRIRMKIEDEPSAPQYIQTIWGYGYKWPLATSAKE